MVGKQGNGHAPEREANGSGGSSRTETAGETIQNAVKRLVALVFDMDQPAGLVPGEMAALAVLLGGGGHLAERWRGVREAACDLADALDHETRP